ncbi:hypothetical protein Pcinc_043142 [Petrolisthes cinctipes]|uniref:Uncharacterized protein n=1 Tax=Petrolisthes cinctipes TaxID=88211 RepID=A0AAE1BJB1_PETCI|nr:hypothetical protein Pcinc_043142 [Petrolisthes cinctipes]
MEPMSNFSHWLVRLAKTSQHQLQEGTESEDPDQPASLDDDDNVKYLSQFRRWDGHSGTHLTLFRGGGRQRWGAEADRQAGRQAGRGRQ